MNSIFPSIVSGVVSTSVAVLLLLLFALPNTANAAFDLTSKNNLVLYWGQDAHGSYDPNPASFQRDLLTYCKNTYVDLISVAFVTALNDEGGHLEVNFANMGGNKVFPGTKLLNCPAIGADIKACQKLGKKILISIGGSGSSDSGFENEAAAYAAADKIWNAFGSSRASHRPFGDAVVDGFDLDIVLSPSKYYEHFAGRLRELARKDPSKKYLLTASPQCMLPDLHLATALIKVEFDAVFVQFYNNPSCAASMWPRVANGADANEGFNFGQWDSWVKSKSRNKYLKVFLSLPASAKVATAGGYVASRTAADIIAGVANYTSFAGVALWDASEAAIDPGFVHTVKKALDKLSPVKGGYRHRRF